MTETRTDAGRPSALPPDLEDRKRRAFAWFTELRDRIGAALEAIEADLPAGMPFADRPPAGLSEAPVAAQGPHRRATAAAA